MSKQPYVYVLSQAQLDAIMYEIMDEVRAKAVRILRAGERSDPINDYADKAYIRQALGALGDAPEWVSGDDCFSLDPIERDV